MGGVGGGDLSKKDKGKDSEIVAINADISTMEIDEVSRQAAGALELLHTLCMCSGNGMVSRAVAHVLMHLVCNLCGQSISFTSIGGLDGHIRSLKESVFLPLTYPEVFEKLGIKVTPAQTRCCSTPHSGIGLLPCAL